MILGTYRKQTADELDYDVEYEDWLIDSDGLSQNVAPEVTVEPEGLEILSVTRDYDNRRVKIWVGGGEDGEQYKVSITLETSEGRVRQDEFYIIVRDV